MFLKQRKIRKFEYSPRFYQPQKLDEDENRRIKFRRLRSWKKPKKRSFVGMIIIIAVLLWLIHYFNSFSVDKQEEQKMRDLNIEMIE